MQTAVRNPHPAANFFVLYPSFVADEYLGFPCSLVAAGIRRMETMESITIVLLGVGVFFLFLLLVAVWRVGGGVVRVERRLAELAEQERIELPSLGAPVGVRKALPDRTRDGAFEEFLGEDPERRKLEKREQFAAYRKWRKERGLNWAVE
jgi:hypothetical protein